MVPYSIDSLKRTKSNWDPREDTTEDIIRELNRTSKQRLNNNRISITYLKPESKRIFDTLVIFSRIFLFVE